MSQTATDVGNMALIHIGVAPPFMTDITTDTTKPGVLLNAALDVARRFVLAAHPWNFATKRTTIAALTITGAVDNGSGLIRITTSTNHWFATGDKITINSVQGTTEANGDWLVINVSATTFDLQSSTFTNTYVSGGRCAFFCDHEYVWGFKTPDDILTLQSVDDDPETDYDYAETRIFTNDTSLELKYTADVTNYAVMSAQFYHAFALYLAWMVAYPITDSTSIRDNCWTMYGKAISKARFKDSAENPMKKLETTTLIRARKAKSGYLADPKRFYAP